MSVTCPHCLSRQRFPTRELIAGKAFVCPSCRGRSEVNPDLRRAIGGALFFVATFILSLIVGGSAIYNREMFVRYPALSWGLVVAIVSVVGYLLYATRKPLVELPS